jgi:hypothetical protein
MLSNARADWRARDSASRCSRNSCVCTCRSTLLSHTHATPIAQRLPVIGGSGSCGGVGPNARLERAPRGGLAAARRGERRAGSAKSEKPATTESDDVLGHDVEHQAARGGRLTTVWSAARSTTACTEMTDGAEERERNCRAHRIDSSTESKSANRLHRISLIQTLGRAVECRRAPLDNIATRSPSRGKRAGDDVTRRRHGSCRACGRPVARRVQTDVPRSSSVAAQHRHGDHGRRAGRSRGSGPHHCHDIGRRSVGAGLVGGAHGVGGAHLRAIPRRGRRRSSRCDYARSSRRSGRAARVARLSRHEQ